jgi:hypothetical protein
MMNTEKNRYLYEEYHLLLGLILKSLSVPVSLLCLASVSLASTAIVHVPKTSYLIADARTESTKTIQCRTLFETVVDTRRMGQGFYSRKASGIRNLRLSDGKLQSLQSRFSTVFQGLDGAQRSGDSNANSRLGRQASQLVNELNRHCFH